MPSNNTVTICRAELAKLLTGLGLDPVLSERAEFSGDDQVFPTGFRVGAAAGIALAAAHLAAFGQRLRIDLDLAALTTQGYRRVQLDDASVAAPRDALTGFYTTQDGRSIFLHVNFAHHRTRLLALLGADPTRDSIASRAREWDSGVLEDALAEAGAIGAVARTLSEWAASPQGRALAGLSPIEVIKIGEGPVEALSDAVPLRVIDFTRVLAGPTCGKTLAELGARVTRIDNPLYPDLLSYQLDANRNKEQVTLDLRERKARDKLEGMIGASDVFLQAYRPGVVAAFGLDETTLARARPGIVCATLSAYGHVGPWAGRRGFDSVLQASAGLAMQQDEGAPKLLPVSPIDYMSGYLLAFGVNVALGRRAREGGSYLVRTSLAQAANWLVKLGLNDTPGDGDIESLVARHSMVSPGPLGSVTHLRSPITRIGSQNPTGRMS
ncbi:MAG: carnitine dehydratase [Hyphomicrobiales bacterium]|nr:carnitine dehydratase [Hyphomicrobiales bacterium]